jgi:hypothetical protein
MLCLAMFLLVLSLEPSLTILRIEKCLGLVVLPRSGRDGLCNVVGGGVDEFRSFMHMHSVPCS